MIGDVGMSELLVIFLIVLILFGADRIPTLAKGLGKGIREFKRIVNNANDEIQRAIDINDTMPPKPPKRMPPKPAQHDTFTDIASDEMHQAMDIDDALPPVKKQEAGSENETNKMQQPDHTKDTSPPKPTPPPTEKNES